MTPSKEVAREEAPNFAAPWEAQAFALRAHLVETGKVDATRFAELLGAALREAPEPADDGTSYYVAFVGALEQAVAEFVDPARLEAERKAWHRAAAATPHGEPIDIAKGRDA